MSNSATEPINLTEENAQAPDMPRRARGTRSTTSSDTQLCVIDLTRDSPRNNISPTVLVGASASLRQRLFDIIDLSPTNIGFPYGTVHKISRKRCCRASDASMPTPQKRRLNLSCPICLEDLDFEGTTPEKQMMSTICGHIFCNPCIRSVIKETKSCPVCRKKLSLRSIHPLYF